MFRIDVEPLPQSQKTKKDSPTWHMVDVEFKSRARHFVPLSVLKSIAAGDKASAPVYLTSEDLDAIKGRFGFPPQFQAYAYDLSLMRL